MRVFLAVAALLAFLVPTQASQSQYFNYGPVVEVPELMMAGPLGDRGLGNPSAPVTVIEYASMTCPHCQQFHLDSFPALKTKYIDTGQVYFILREFPLDAVAFAAFMVARCSADSYFDVIDVLFKHQETWAFAADPIGAMLTFTAPYGIATEAHFEACIGRKEVFDHVDAVATRGYEAFGVEGTPTFFFNGNRVVGDLPIEGVDQMIARVLGRPG